MKYIIVNTKNKFTEEAAKKYYEAISNINFDKVKLIICPKKGHLHIFSKRMYCLGVQGDYSIDDIKNSGITHAVVGHYDNRTKGETDLNISIKVNLLQKMNIKPILCIGEENKSDNVYSTLTSQIDSVYSNIVNKNKIILAYEPFWSIGNNSIVSFKYIEENILFIKKYITEKYNNKATVVYGGSVNINNINILNASKHINGFMISTSALNDNNLLKLVESIEE